MSTQSRVKGMEASAMDKCRVPTCRKSEKRKKGGVSSLVWAQRLLWYALSINGNVAIALER